MMNDRDHLYLVTPFTGVWIETFYSLFHISLSPVTPFTGVWIETPMDLEISTIGSSHTLYGCVD